MTTTETCRICGDTMMLDPIPGQTCSRTCDKAREILFDVWDEHWHLVDGLLSRQLDHEHAKPARSDLRRIIARFAAHRQTSPRSHRRAPSTSCQTSRS